MSMNKDLMWLKQNPEDVGSYPAVLSDLNKNHKSEQALSIIDEAPKAIQRDPILLFERAKAHQFLSHYNEARRYYAMVLKQSKSFTEKVWEQLGLLEWQDQQLSVAYEYFLKLVDLPNKNPKYFKYAARVAAELGADAQCFQFAQQAVRLKAEPESLYLLGISARALGRVREAYQALRNMHMLEPDNTKYKLIYAKFLQEISNKEVCEESLEQ